MAESASALLERATHIPLDPQHQEMFWEVLNYLRANAQSPSVSPDAWTPWLDEVGQSLDAAEEGRPHRLYELTQEGYRRMMFTLNPAVKELEQQTLRKPQLHTAEQIDERWRRGY